jgi:assimilatory nitrate reductase catalytic subunit
MVGESAAIRAAWPACFAELHPETASRLGVSDGDPAQVSSSRGKISVTVRVDRKTPVGAVYVPSGAGEAPSNALLSADDLMPTVTLEKQSG